MFRRLLILFTLLLAACFNTSTPEATQAPATSEPAIHEITVELGEWSILPSPDEASAGEVTFEVANLGEKPHELHVVATDLDPADLKTNEDGSADLSEFGHGDHVAELKPGDSGSVEAELEPGPYLLVCNLVDGDDVHYKLGMRTAFQVT